MQVTQVSARRRFVVIHTALVAFSLAAWAWLLVALRGKPILFGTPSMVAVAR